MECEDNILLINSSKGMYDFSLQCSVQESIKNMPMRDCPEILARSQNMEIKEMFEKGKNQHKMLLHLG